LKKITELLSIISYR